MNEPGVPVIEEEGEKTFGNRRWRYTIYALLAISFGYIHYKYVGGLFEQDRSFQYLSNLEREMSLYTEMGFYYSYYKAMVEDKPFFASVTNLMYDKRVEHPTQVNAFKRFNVYPEFLIGAMYSYLEPWLNSSDYRQCHLVNRGPDMSPIRSCTGIGEPIMFYLESVWFLAGVYVALLFLHAATLSESLLGGLLAVGQYFANHNEATRVHWAPNERENMALPLIMLQSWLVTIQLRSKKGDSSLHIQIILLTVNCLCLVFWQFTQFIFLTQLVILYAMEQMRIINMRTQYLILHSHFCGLHWAVLLLHGNDMLKSSLYTTFFATISANYVFFSYLRLEIKTKWDVITEMLLIALRTAVIVMLTLVLKMAIGEYLEIEDDGHIWEILAAKLTDFKTFHTQMYTCSEAFDYMPMDNVKKWFRTFLIPFVLVSLTNLARYWLKNGISLYRWNRKLNEARRVRREERERNHDNANDNIGPNNDPAENANDPPRNDNDQAGDANDPPRNVLRNRNANLAWQINDPVGNIRVMFGNMEGHVNVPNVPNGDIHIPDDVANGNFPNGHVPIDNDNDNNDNNGNNVNNQVEDDDEDDDIVPNEGGDEYDTQMRVALAKELRGKDGLVVLLQYAGVDPAVVYAIAQLVAYGVMAGMVMRLQLLLVPQMCLVASLAMNGKYFRFHKRYSHLLFVFWAVTSVPVAQQIFKNVHKEMSHVGEFSDIHQEEMLQWISRYTSPDAAVAGSMPVSSSIMLSTRRSIVSHPHYERKEARERAYTVYQMYGRVSASELHKDLTKYKADYLVLEIPLCYGQSSTGCTYLSMWDAERPDLKDRPPLCNTLLTTSTEHFFQMFRNAHYAIFKIHDLSIRYMPRSFDT